MPRRLTWIPEDAPAELFPDPQRAMRHPNGLLAAGGTLDPARLLAAYRRGIFPWFSDGEPILWWSPDPRMVLVPERLHIARSLRRTLRRAGYRVTADRAFVEVIEACAGPRDGADGTWITAEMQASYIALHRLGRAHSLEVWQDDRLVGGIYGIVVGRVFCGESMFSRASDASKVAMVELCQRGFALIDGQVESPLLEQLGFKTLSRDRFIAELDRHAEEPDPLT